MVEEGSDGIQISFLLAPTEKTFLSAQHANANDITNFIK